MPVGAFEVDVDGAAGVPVPVLGWEGVVDEEGTSEGLFLLFSAAICA